MERPSDFWRNVVRDLMTEHRVSARELHRRTGLSRMGLNRFLNGETTALTVTKLQTILNVFGYELEIVRRGGDDAL